MKIAILGAGNVGKANSAYLAHMGHQVVLYDRNRERLEPIEKKGLIATGRVEGEFWIDGTDDLPSAVKGSKLILVCTVAAGHKPLAAALKGLLEPGQDILITNGCWGAVEFDMELGEEAAQKGCTISETNGQLILCNSPEPNSVYLKTIKEQMALACTCPQKTGEVLERLHEIYPQFRAAANVLYTSLNNSNPICHGPMVLFNITRMENGEDYLMFRSCMTQRVSAMIEAADKERVNVVRACGVEAPAALEMLNASWPVKQTSLYDVFHKTPAYAVTKGPKTLNHRYLTEDLPYGLVPYVRLGQKMGVATPALSLILQMLGLYMETDYLAQGPELEKASLSKFL